MNKKLFYKSITIIFWVIVVYLIYINNQNKPRIGYTVKEELEKREIIPVHTVNIEKIINERWPQFNNEKDCQKWSEWWYDNRVCYNINPEYWVWFYMWDSEPRPVFKTYEECEDWAISMMPYSFVKNAKWGVHAWDWDTRCSQWCHYSYKYFNSRVWTFSCDKTIHSVIWRADKFEKIMDKLDKWRNYDRFIDAFWNDTIGCDIKIKNNDDIIYSYFIWIWHKIGISRYDVVSHSNDKIMTRQKNKKDWEIFYIQQMDWLLYVRWDIIDKWIWKIYKIKNWDDNVVFENMKQLFENKKIEISCHRGPDYAGFYTLPQDVKWIDAWTVDNIYYRLDEN